MFGIHGQLYSEKVHQIRQVLLKLIKTTQALVLLT